MIYLRGRPALKLVGFDREELHLPDHSIRLPGITLHVTYPPAFEKPVGGPVLGYCDRNLYDSGFTQRNSLGEQRECISVRFKIWYTSYPCIR